MADAQAGRNTLRDKLQSLVQWMQLRGLDEQEQVDRIVLTSAAVCGLAAAQPIPFADIFILTPLQGVMAGFIARSRGVSLTDKGATALVKDLVRLVGLGWLAQQTTIGLYKFIPYMGSMTSIPIVFALTYAMGRLIDAYLVARREGRTLSQTVARQILQHEREVGAKLLKTIARGSESLADALTGKLNELVSEVRAGNESIASEIQSLRSDLASWYDEFAQIRSAFTKEHAQPSEEDYQRFADTVAERVDAWHREHERGALDLARDRLVTLPCWPDLDARSRSFLTTGEHLWATQQERELDFAPVSLEYCKVVEVELKEWLERLRGLVRRNSILEKDRLISFPGRSEAPVLRWMARQSPRQGSYSGEPSLFDIELFLSALVDAPTGTPIPAGDQRLAIAVRRTYQSTPLPPRSEELPSFVREVRQRYRNGAAHTKALDAASVREFRELLLGAPGVSGMLEVLVALKRWPE